MKKIKKAAVRQLVNIRISATTSRLIEIIGRAFRKTRKALKLLCEAVTTGNINSLYYNIYWTNRTRKMLGCQYNE
jgi:hypothetical protein